MPTTSAALDIDSHYKLTTEQIAYFREMGFIHLKQVLSPEVLAYYGERNIAQGMQAARSSVDIGLAMPVLEGSGELTFTVTDLFNDFGLKHYIDGDGFDAVYENFFETQVVSVGLTRKF